MTAVEWYNSKLIQIDIDFGGHKNYWLERNKALEESLEMEKQQMEISDEEIDNYADDKMTTLELYQGFISGAKWYREKLKKVK